VRTLFSVTKTVFAQAAERPVAAARERSVEEVERLLAAAETVLGDGGYERLRVDDVLAKAGLSTRAFYRHFRGKAELFLALFDREAERAGAHLGTKVAAAGDPEAGVRAWVAATLSLAHDPRLARRTRLFVVERHVIAREFPAEIELGVDAQRAPLEAAIAAGLAEGRFPHADPVVDALAVHHLCLGLVTDRLLGLGELDRDRAVALATGFALQTLRTDGRERRPS
jgi:AcrR family transcriptional regulator